MQSSWEVLSILLKAMGAVVGLATVCLVLFLLARDSGTRKAAAKIRESTLIVADFVFSVAGEYFRSLKALGSDRLLSKGRQLAKSLLSE